MTVSTPLSWRDAETIIPAVVPWVHEAGNPYVDWVFGGALSARQVISKWMARPTSEIWAGRLRVRWAGDEIVGGYIALRGSQLTVSRRADAIATAQHPGDRRERLARLAVVRDLFAPVAPDDLYLSRMGVAPAWRGRGHGKAILEDFLALGAAENVTRLRLDVRADGAIRALYERVGFLVMEERRSEEAGVAYLAMVKEPL